MSFEAIGTRTRARGVPSLAEAVSATGGIAVAIGVLLITVDIRADHPGRGAEAALFGGLVLLGYLAVLLLPVGTHGAGVSAIVLGIPGALGWLLLPGAHSFGDIRPFLVLTILAWLAAFVLPRTQGRTIFVAAAALLLWLWILGEVAGSSAYSAAPIPSPPAHTLFSLQAFTTARTSVDLSDLDSTDPLYPLAEQCAGGDSSSCDTLYREAPSGSDFRAFAATCGNSSSTAVIPGSCGLSVSNPFIQTPGSIPTLNPISPIRGATEDKSLEIGLVSTFFGIAYLAALLVLDRGKHSGIATAFVVPGFVALLSGTEALGNAAHHAWVGGLLTLVAGIGIGLVGDATKRRFTTWAGAAAAAFGTLTVALDTAHISRAFGSQNVKLAGPGFIVVGFGLGLVALAVVLAGILGWTGGTPAGGSPPPFSPVSSPLADPTVAPAAVWDPAPWQPPPASPASAPTGRAPRPFLAPTRIVATRFPAKTKLPRPGRGPCRPTRVGDSSEESFARHLPAPASAIRSKIRRPQTRPTSRRFVGRIVRPAPRRAPVGDSFEDSSPGDAAGTPTIRRKNR